MNSNKQSFFCLAIFCAAVLFVSHAVAQQDTTTPPSTTPQQQAFSAPKPGMKAYAGKIMALSGEFAATPTDLWVKVYRYSTPEEVQKCEDLLTEKGGQEKLQDALRDANDVGAFRLGVAGNQYAIKIAIEEQTKKGRRIRLLAVRHTALRPEQSPVDYRFTMITLDLDDQGNGDGSYTSPAKIHFNKKHVLEVQDSKDGPANVNKVHPDA